MKSDLIVYQLSRVKVEQGDFNHFLDLYDPHKLPTGQPLKATMGRMLFCIEGYDADPREIYLIPEVRRFYQAFHRIRPARTGSIHREGFSAHERHVRAVHFRAPATGVRVFSTAFCCRRVGN